MSLLLLLFLHVAASSAEDLLLVRIANALVTTGGNLVYGDPDCGILSEDDVKAIFRQQRQLCLNNGTELLSTGVLKCECSHTNHFGACCQRPCNVTTTISTVTKICSIETKECSVYEFDESRPDYC